MLSNDKVIEICTNIEFDRLYIDDCNLQNHALEAIQLLRPFGGFHECANASPIQVARDVVKWLRPLIQAHIKNEPLPAEPEVIDTYRQAHNEAKARWDRFWGQYDR